MSNSSAVMNEIPIQDRACKLKFNENGAFSVKTLGILWIAAEDNFTFKFKGIDQVFKFTKRDFLKRATYIIRSIGISIIIYSKSQDINARNINCWNRLGRSSLG